MFHLQKLIYKIEKAVWGTLSTLKAEIHWSSDRPGVWRLSVYTSQNRQEKSDFDFYVPRRIFSYWKAFNLDKTVALDIKQEFFSKVFVFNKRDNPEAPFTIINIDREWLDAVRQELVDEV